MASDDPICSANRDVCQSPAGKKQACKSILPNAPLCFRVRPGSMTRTAFRPPPRKRLPKARDEGKPLLDKNVETCRDCRPRNPLTENKPLFFLLNYFGILIDIVSRESRGRRACSRDTQSPECPRHGFAAVEDRSLGTGCGTPKPYRRHAQGGSEDQRH